MFSLPVQQRGQAVTTHLILTDMSGYHRMLSDDRKGVSRCRGLAVVCDGNKWINGVCILSWKCYILRRAVKHALWLDLGSPLPGLTLECAAPQNMNHCGIQETCLLNKQRTALDPMYCASALLLLTASCPPIPCPGHCLGTHCSISGVCWKELQYLPEWHRGFQWAAPEWMIPGAQNSHPRFSGTMLERAEHWVRIIGELRSIRYSCVVAKIY